MALGRKTGGRRKGTPKTGGRKKGTPNKATAEVKAIAQQYTAEAIATLVQVMQSGESEQARIAAARELLDRGHGKPRQPLRHEGLQPAELVVTTLSSAEDVRAILGQPVDPHDDEDDERGE